MQQVETGSRFWWRALDAQTPEPPASHAPRFLQTRRTAPMPHAGFTLHVPKGDRRRPARKTSRLPRSAAIVMLSAIIAGSAAVVAVTLPEASLADMRETAANAATRTLIASGFGIDQVSLTGQRYTLDSDVFDALDLANVKTFAALDTVAALKRIERIAWVDTAQLTRVFPGKLNIEIKERAPAAIWSRGDKTYLIDATGRTLGPIAAANSWGLPRISGEGGNAEASLLLASVARHKEIAAKFAYAERIAERRWSLVLTNGTRIELGADREIEGLDQVMRDATLRNAVSTGSAIIDVRIAGRSVVRPSRVAQVPAPSTALVGQAP